MSKDELRKDLAQLFNRASNTNPKSRSETISDAVGLLDSYTKEEVLGAQVFEINQALIVAETKGMTIKFMREALERRYQELSTPKDNTHE